ncbi:uncharacterized protein LOC132257614 [Phlebotomus argentipes]|uniref:uncharacterized protein LOC132257614 n=1 Tax=Phlebotomus argentipes TaxID=94469 RepID=UPI00289357A5|nr:uncharacterized protein LOC132257614 [Phlebotomus argentipes]
MHSSQQCQISRSPENQRKSSEREKWLSEEEKMSYAIKFIVVFMIIGATLAEEPQKAKGIKYEKFEESPGSEKYLKHNIKAEQVNETAFKMSVEIEQLDDWDNAYEVVMSIHHSPNNDGKYKEIFATPKEKICDYMAGEIYRDHVYPQFKDISNFPAPGDCPVKKGVYKIEEHIFNVNELDSFGQLGGWRVDNTFFKDGEMISENKMYFTVY